jgi:hypothetical protein
MKVRTCILSICMVVVPAMAMFSHHLPEEVRSAARCQIWEPLMDRMTDWFDRAEASAATAETGSVEPAIAGVPIPLGPTGGAIATGGAGDVAERLAAVGAVVIDCRPLEGAAGTHVASCRVAMDAGGQLHRVFQAAGPDPTAATAALASQVEAWRERLALRAGEAAAPAGRY